MPVLIIRPSLRELSCTTSLKIRITWIRLKIFTVGHVVICFNLPAEGLPTTKLVTILPDLKITPIIRALVLVPGYCYTRPQMTPHFLQMPGWLLIIPKIKCLIAKVFYLLKETGMNRAC
ncbi:hypothetical protein D3C71_1553650 [compost metagenome]